MDLSSMSNDELISLYSSTIKELKTRGVLRTSNVTGELGERIVIDYYRKVLSLPTLTAAPIGTENYNAVSENGEKYSIKSTSGHVTGVFYGLEAPGSAVRDKKLFDYVIICKLDDSFSVEGIYQLSWDGFLKHKKWHSRMKAWNLSLTQLLIKDSVKIYEKGQKDNTAINAARIITWLPKEKIDHTIIRSQVAERVSITLKTPFEKYSSSRYVSKDNDSALFVLSASYSEKNQEFWYSIDFEIIPWIELYPQGHFAFALGSSENILLFTFSEIKSMLSCCRTTQEDLAKKKKAHYHIAFSVDGRIVYFKKKLPTREYVNVTSALI